MERHAKITSVELHASDKQRFIIHLDGEPAFIVHEDLLVKYRLLKGETLTVQQVKEIEAEEDRTKAYLEGLSYLSRRPRSAKEVHQHLKRKAYPPEWINFAVQRLQEQGYLNDRQFAKQWTSHRIRSQKKGRLWIRQELAEKGIAKEQIAEAIQEVDKDTEYRNALELARRRWKGGDSVDERKQRQKLMAFLLRRGYPSSIVHRALREVTTISDEDHYEESPD
jgi:regulatory protein